MVQATCYRTVSAPPLNQAETETFAFRNMGKQMVFSTHLPQNTGKHRKRHVNSTARPPFRYPSIANIDTITHRFIMGFS